MSNKISSRGTTASPRTLEICSPANLTVHVEEHKKAEETLEMGEKVETIDSADFLVDRNVVAKISPFFKSLVMNKHFSEANKTRVVLKEMKPDIIELIFRVAHDKEKAAEEEAAREKAAEAQAAREQAAKEQAAKEQAAKEQSAKDGATREEPTKDEAAKPSSAEPAIESKPSEGTSEPSWDVKLSIDDVWNLLAALGQYGIEATDFKKWFAGQYQRLRKECDDSRKLLYPCFTFDYVIGFLETTKSVVYDYGGHLEEVNPTKHRHLHLPQRVIRKSSVYLYLHV